MEGWRRPRKRGNEGRWCADRQWWGHYTTASGPSAAVHVARMALERSSVVQARLVNRWVGEAGQAAKATSCATAACRSRSAAARAAQACALPHQARNRSPASHAVAASAREVIAAALERTLANAAAAHASRLRHKRCTWAG